MNKKLGITAITLVAVTMVIAAVSPAVYAQVPPRDPGCEGVTAAIALLETLDRVVPPDAFAHIQDAIVNLSQAARVLCD